jgi:Ras-related protein Rab-11A
LCYDITKRKSFENISLWLTEMRANCEPVVLMLVGTKTDLQYLREVSTEEALEYAQKEHMMFMETSAQSAYNVEEAFTEVTRTIFQHIHKDLDDDRSGVLLKGNTLVPIEEQTTFPKEQRKGPCACAK